MTRHRIEFTDGTTTVECNDQNPIEAASWSFGSPDTEDVETEPSVGRDGGEVFGVTRRNVSDSIVLLIPTSSANARTEINDLEDLLLQAADYQATRIGSRVFLQVQWEQAGDVYRTEVLSGSLRVETVSIESWGRGVDHWKVTVRFKRRFFWEGPEAELPLTNTNGTDTTGGLEVQNHDDADAGDDNFVTITGSDVDGVLPAPCRIEMTNTTPSATYSQRLDRIWVSHNFNSDPANLVHILEGEDSTIGTTQTDANTSGGEYQEADNALSTSLVELYRWTISTAQLNAAGGNYVRLLVRWRGSVSDDTQFRVRLKFQLETIYESELVEQPDPGAFTQRIAELVTVQLPPYLVGTGDLHPITLHLYGKHATSTATLQLDYLALAPLDGWRTYDSVAYGIGENVRLVDDMLLGFVYTDGWSSSGKVGNIAAFGEPIMLEPGADQRLYFYQMDTVGSAQIDRTMDVQVYYRPRRLTV